MKRGAKAQAAMEYVMIAGLVAIIIIPTTLIFYNYASDSANEIDQAQIGKFGRDLVNTAESVYYLGPPSRIVIEERLPANIESISVDRDAVTGNYLFAIAARSKSGVSNFTFPSTVRIDGLFTQSDLNSGIKKVWVTAQRDSSGQPYGDVRFGNWRRVFVTSTAYRGDFGLEGADANCQARANAAGLGGVWKAWLSTTDTDAGDRIGNHRFVLLDGTTLAESFADLTDGTIQSPIELTEIGTTVLVSIWTGTLQDGKESEGQTCNDWTGSGSGLQGGSAESNDDWTDWWTTGDCTQLRGIYCFEE